MSWPFQLQCNHRQRIEQRGDATRALTGGVYGKGWGYDYSLQQIVLPPNRFPQNAINPSFGKDKGMLISMNGIPEAGWGRVGVFKCECGCGQTFFRTIKTRHPRYANKTHRARAYRARARARVVANENLWEYCGDRMEYYPLCYENALSEELAKNRGR